MPDAVHVGLLGIAGNLLASLNSSNPKNNFQALKIVDENDPIRLSLKAMKGQYLPPGTCLMLVDGTILGLSEVLEVGYGAARLVISIIRTGYLSDSRPQDFINHRSHDVERFNTVLRYQVIRGILEPRGSDR